jgi:hypothetical protein
VSDFGELRSLLHGASPTQATFDAVVQAFKEADDPGEAERVWLPYAHDRMRAWPDERRRVVLDGEAALGEGSWCWLELARELELGGKGWSDEVVRELVGSSRLSGLRVFDAPATQLPDPVLHWIGSSPHLAGLTGLALKWVRGAQGGLARVASAGVKLERLELRRCFLDDDDFDVFGVFAPTLEVLAVEACGLGERGAWAIAQAARLRRLSLLENPLGARGAAILARGEAAFERLNLSRCTIEDEGLIALIESGRLDACVELGLEYGAISPAGAHAIVGSGARDTLTSLDMRWNPLGEDGVRALAEARWPALTELRVEEDVVAEPALRLLATSPRLRRLERAPCYIDARERAALEALRAEGAALNPWARDVLARDS